MCRIRLANLRIITGSVFGVKTFGYRHNELLATGVPDYKLKARLEQQKKAQMVKY